MRVQGQGLEVTHRIRADGTHLWSVGLTLPHFSKGRKNHGLSVCLGHSEAENTVVQHVWALSGSGQDVPSYNLFLDFSSLPGKTVF